MRAFEIDKTGGVQEEQLAGGVANAGNVVRIGDHVLRPSNVYSRSVHQYLSALRAAGFDGASNPVGIDEDGRERLVFIEGDVPVPPYPTWAQSDVALASIASLLRSMHDAVPTFDASAFEWSTEMADPEGGSIICHNDVCLENVVFVDGRAVGLLDFDFAAPGRPVYDVAQFARMCVPIDDETSAGRLGWLPADLPARLRLVADAYGLGRQERRDLIDVISTSIARGGEFVVGRVEAGDPNFIAMWNEIGGMERFDRRRQWWIRERERFVAALQ